MHIQYVIHEKNASFRHEDALLDFASVVQLDKNMACAHCNMGVIHLTSTNLYDKAAKHFTEALKCQPNYIRAVICRADAYDQMKLVRNDF